MSKKFNEFGIKRGREMSGFEQLYNDGARGDYYLHHGGTPAPPRQTISLLGST